MSENRKGMIFSKEHKNNMSLSQKGKSALNKQKVEAYIYKTGEYIGVYESYSDCANQLNIHGGHINQVISGKRNHTHGYTFKKV